MEEPRARAGPQEEISSSSGVEYEGVPTVGILPTLGEVEAHPVPSLTIGQSNLAESQSIPQSGVGGSGFLLR